MELGNKSDVSRNPLPLVKRRVFLGMDSYRSANRSLANGVLPDAKRWDC